MKVGTITFHGAHNYGSMLQAYALQQAIQKMNNICQIINFRSPAQKQMYKVISGRRGFGPLLKDISHLFFYHSLVRKQELFESFLQDYLVTTSREYHTLEELQQESFDFDAIVCGSDQIWKPTIADFSWAYLLPFCYHAKHIAYAPSYGPSPKFSMECKEQFKKYLKRFDAISVREEGTKEVVESLSDLKGIQVVCDPVFLLPKEQWLQIIDSVPIVQKPYIFFYTLFADKEMIQIVKRVSKLMDLPVVVSNFSTLYDLTAGFELKLECGPREFLNLIQHATYVCTSSFHGTALATILNKPLISIRGMKDNRIRSILEKFGLQSYSVNNLTDVDRVCNLGTCDLKEVNAKLAAYRQSGMSFLHKNLSHD